MKMVKINSVYVDANSKYVKTQVGRGLCTHYFNKNEVIPLTVESKFCRLEGFLQAYLVDTFKVKPTLIHKAYVVCNDAPIRGMCVTFPPKGTKLWSDVEVKHNGERVYEFPRLKSRDYINVKTWTYKVKGYVELCRRSKHGKQIVNIFPTDVIYENTKS